MLTCTRLISRFFSNAHHHGSLPQQLGVVWDQLLKTDPEGPTLISHAAYPHDWSVHDELLSVCACSTLYPRKSKRSVRASFTEVFAPLSVSPSLVITAFVHARASAADCWLRMTKSSA